MALKIWELVSILVSALVTGVFWGPWLGLSRSADAFQPEVFIAVVQRMFRNLAPVMTVLMPAAMLSILPVLFLSYNERQNTFYLNVAGLGLFIIVLLVTVVVEVPIAMQIDTWTTTTLPDNWEQLRDRWKKYHVLRTLTSIAGFLVLLIAAIF
jgi:uncharacterized membrane protein